METKEYSSLDQTWPIQVPSTVAEYDEWAKKEGSCLADAINHTAFHSTLGDIRSAYTDALEEWNKAEAATGRQTLVSRESGDKDEDGNAILLNDGKFYAKFMATLGLKPSDIPQSIKDEVLKKHGKLDPSSTPRTPGGGKKLAKTYITSANELLAKHGQTVVVKGQTKTMDVSVIVAKLSELNPDAGKDIKIDENTGLPTPESLARLISANEARKRAELKLTETVAAETLV